MYTTIYNLLVEAVFGLDAVLTASQTFAIDQIAIILSILVTLVPLFIVLAILWRCVK